VVVRRLRCGNLGRCRRWVCQQSLCNLVVLIAATDFGEDGAVVGRSSVRAGSCFQVVGYAGRTRECSFAEGTVDTGAAMLIRVEMLFSLLA
jgi:hypothetical protein